ncbi:MAG: hypothetical protein HY320_03360 [Armatimonadetes bacterium]|nr:hypothetical protein [Armatimonadota bacterium]
MRRRANLGRTGAILALGIALASGVPLRAAPPTTGASPRAAVPALELFDGRPMSAMGIRLASWGSGTATEAKDVSYTGESSIRIGYHGYYSGGRIILEQPRDLNQQCRDPYGILEFTVKYPPPGHAGPSVAGMPGGGPMEAFMAGGGMGPMGGAPGGVYPPAGTRPQSRSARGGGYAQSGRQAQPRSTQGGVYAPSGGRAQPQGGRGGGYAPPGGAAGWGGAYPPANEQVGPAATRRVRVVLVFEEGTAVATNYPLALFADADTGWFKFTVPFAAFKGLDQLSGHTLKEIRLFGDARDLVWIGQIRTRSDDEEIVVDPLESGLVVAVGEPVEFSATATAGFSALDYSWDFDKEDGIQEDATGSRLVHVFRKPSPLLSNGDAVPFTVTLTITDVSGAKKQVRRETDVTVNE